MAINWEQLEKINDEYRRTAGTALDVERFNLYAITHHSTRIEGSTLTEVETAALLEKGLTIGGKPLEHQNMVLDHYEALIFILERAKHKHNMSVGFIQEICARVMKRTGREISAPLGNTDEKKGDFRTVNVTAGGHYFVSPQNVRSLTEQFAASVNEKMKQVKEAADVYALSFTAHFDLVSIHPFTDGNGRTSRLLMNYIQAYHGLPLTVVDSADRAHYIEALKNTREKKDTAYIVNFLADQHIKFLDREIQAFKKSMSHPRSPDERGYSLIF